MTDEKCITILVVLELCSLSQYQISDCETIHLFLFLIQALHSTMYMVNFTTIQCRQNFGYAFFLIPILSISHCTHHPCIFALNTVNCLHTVHVLSKCLYIVATHSVNYLYIVNETLSILHEGIQ